MIIFSMAGRGQRFVDQGYTLPKYALPLEGKPVFHHVLEGFRAYFEQEPFLFICLDQPETIAFVHQACLALGIEQFHIATVAQVTRGQAETVQVGLDQVPPDWLTHSPNLTIFNIDTIRPDFRYPDWLTSEWDGYLEVFEAPGDHWSFVVPDPQTPHLAIGATEKERVSDLCSNGLYYFRSWQDFQRIFQQAVVQWEQADPATRKELYIAPLYNQLIQQGRRIGYEKVGSDQVLCCGTPAEYEILKARLCPV